MIIHMRHTLWTGISETNVNVITSATRTHAFNNNNTHSISMVNCLKPMLSMFKIMVVLVTSTVQMMCYFLRNVLMIPILRIMIVLYNFFVQVY